MIFRCLFVILSFAAVIRATDERIRNAGLTARTKFEGNQQNDSDADIPAYPTIRRKRLSASSVDIIEFKKDALIRHNQYRSYFGVNPLKLSDELNNRAQKYAMNLADTDAPKKWSPLPDIGVCLYEVAWDTVESGYDPVDYWYQEIINYNFNDPESNLDQIEDIGQFTQVIWKNTTDVGFGYAWNAFYTYVVAFYKPAGNTENDFAENVPKLQNKSWYATENVPKLQNKSWYATENVPELQNKSCRENGAYNTQVTVSLLLGCTLLIPFIRYIYL